VRLRCDGRSWASYEDLEGIDVANDKRTRAHVTSSCSTTFMACARTLRSQPAWEAWDVLVSTIWVWKCLGRKSLAPHLLHLTRPHTNVSRGSVSHNYIIGVANSSSISTCCGDIALAARQIKMYSFNRKPTSKPIRPICMAAYRSPGCYMSSPEHLGGWWPQGRLWPRWHLHCPTRLIASVH